MVRIGYNAPSISPWFNYQEREFLDFPAMNVQD